MADNLDESLFELSDEELEAAYREAISSSQNNSDDDNTDQTSEDVRSEEIQESEEHSDMNSPESGNDDNEYDTSVEENTEDMVSDDNNDITDDEDEVEEEEDADNEEDNDSSNDTESEEETSDTQKNDSSEKDEKSDDASEEAKKLSAKIRKYKANGQEFEFTEEEVLDKFGKVFAQSMNYTQKMQAIAPYRKMISALESENLTADDVNLMIDAIKGNKDAVATLLKKANVDPLSIDTEEASEYTPTAYGKNEAQLQLDDIVNEINKDPEFVTTANVVDKIWDDKSRQLFAKNVELIKELHYDIKDGTFDEVNPLAIKMKVYDGGKRSDVEYYAEARRTYQNQKQARELSARIQTELAPNTENTKIKKLKEDQLKQKKLKSSAQRKRSAAPSNTRAKPKVTTYLDDSDEEFEKWYKELQDKM